MNRHRVFLIGCVSVLLTTSASKQVAAENESEIKPGPMLQERTVLWQKIEKAKEQGIGVGGYESAFRSMEDTCGPTAQDSAIKPQVDSISKAIDDQLQRARYLKTQRVVPSASVNQKSNGTSNSGARVGGFPGGTSPDDVTAKLKNGNKDMLDAIQKMNENPDMKALVDRLKKNK